MTSGISSIARARREKSLCAIFWHHLLSKNVTKDAQTGDQPIYASYQEEGEMKKNCYAYILPEGYYGNHRSFVYFS
jgi:hypothetical protein